MVAIVQPCYSATPRRTRNAALPLSCSAAALAAHDQQLLRHKLCNVSPYETTFTCRRGCATFSSQSAAISTLTAQSQQQRPAPISAAVLARVPTPLSISSTATAVAASCKTSAALAASAAAPIAATTVSRAAARLSVSSTVVPPASAATANARRRSASRQARKPCAGTAMAAMGVMPVQFQAGALDRPTAFRVLCYGDSLTVGFYDQGRQYEPYGKELAEALSVAAGMPVEVSVCGHSGHTAQEMVADMDSTSVEDVGGLLSKGLRRALAEQPQCPDLVVIMAGTNDIGGGASPSSTLEYICKLHGVCHSLGIPTLALTPPSAPRAPAGSSFEENRKRLVHLMQRWARTVPGLQGVVNPADLVSASSSAAWDPDRLHFAPAGSKLLGRKLAQLIAPILAQ